MSKFKLTLKWRFTLLTLFIMILTSFILMIAINYDISRTLPYFTGIIIGETDVSSPVPVPDIFEMAIPLPEVEYIYYEDSAKEITIQTAIGETVTALYKTSIISFCIIMIVGGATAYIVVKKALKPITDLNEDIKKINEDHLVSNLKVEGPHDEIKELTISFNKMLAKLENAFTSQKRFNSSVAHELKTPLSVIKTNIDVLKGQKNRTVEEYEQTLEVVERSIIKMDAIIETMLDMIKQENEALEDKVNMENICEDVVDDLRIIASQQNIDLQLELGEITDEIIGNEILLYRAFYNIVENSIKYNHINGIVKVTCKQEKDIIYINIFDTGKGILEEDYENIFKPFYRCDETKLSSTQGVGLGLSLADSVIKMHGGEIKVSSIVGKGTEFYISLPILT